MKRLLTCLLLICAGHLLWAQNDNCTGAITISSVSGTTCTSPLAGTSAGATQSMPGCSGTADDDVWYSFVATSSSHSIAVTGSTNYDAVVELFSGSCSSLTSIVCRDYESYGGTESIHLLNFTPGATYYFRVYDYYSGSGSSTFTVCITSQPTPPNDDCSGAISLTPSASSVCASPIMGSSFGGTESMPGCSGTADDDVWYSFVASAPSHSLSVTGSSNYDAVVEVFSGNCSSLNSLICSDSYGSGSTETMHLGGLTPGSTYYFRVYEYHVDSGSDTFYVCLTTPSILPPTNDDCTGAAPLPVTTGCALNDTTVSSYGATQSMPGCTGTAEDDIWFSFVATYPNETIEVTGLSGADAVVEFFTGSCGSLTSVSCNDHTGTNQTEAVYPSGLTVGQTYYFRIYDYYTNNGDSFIVSVSSRQLVASATSTLICQGQPVTLSAGGTPTHTWSSGVSDGVAFTPTTTTTYTVSGVGSGGCVNIDSVKIVVSTAPQPNICMVTVDTNNVNNVIYWEKVYNNVDSFIVYREVLANVYQRIGAVNDLDFSRFVDTSRSIGFRNGDPNVRSYKYKLQIRDTCGNYSALSNYHTSLFLNNSGNVFTWNFYDIEGQASPVTNYELYRDNNNTNNFQLIGTVSGSVNTYTDAAFSSYPNAKWAVMGDGFSCNPSFKTANVTNVLTYVNKTKGNVKDNLPIPNPPVDPIDPSGIQEMSAASMVKLMPNPASQYVDVVSSLPIKELRVYNYLGEVVYAMPASMQSQVRIQVQDLSTGIYSIEIVGANYRVVKKLQVVK